MVSHTTWIVFAHLVLFNPQGNGNENELASWHQNEFHSLGQCNDFLQQNYVKIDTTLQRHAKRRNARVIIVGCGDKEKLAKTKLLVPLSLTKIKSCQDQASRARKDLVEFTAAKFHSACRPRSVQLLNVMFLVEKCYENIKMFVLDFFIMV